jgi:hypothetical protein
MERREFLGAECAGLGAYWHDLHESRQKAMCVECPAIDECWAEACSCFETWTWGTWAGTTPNDRAVIGLWTEIELRPNPKRPAIR